VPDPQVTGWNPETLKELLDIRFEVLEQSLTRRFDALEREMDERFTQQDKATSKAMDSAALAVEKAERLSDIRAASQNEWRGTVSDILSQEKGTSAHSSESWAKMSVIIVGAGMVVTVAVSILALLFGH